MEIDLTQYTIEEISALRDKCSNHLYSHLDGYDYICRVRSYGRNWNEYISNSFTLQELCNRYDGEDGIVDVYSTNPDLSHITNYGDLMYIPSVEDYNKWKEYEDLSHLIKEIEKTLYDWEHRDEKPFGMRSIFEPSFTQEDLSDLKKKYEEYDTSFTPPRHYE